ncbi:MAG TPA: hypothetical protein VFQ51_19045, partial [Vicinamibacteria bacterium]|nr:hypothetical protein [Vicinamibacteria bacterium]
CLVEQELKAQLNLGYCRALEIAWLRRAAVASVPIWLAAHSSLLPRGLVWLAFLAQGLCLVLGATHGLLEQRWSGRAARLEPRSIAIQTTWTRWDDVRAALWCGLAIVSLVPWAYAGLDRTLPVPLRSTLDAVAWAVLLLLAGAETAATMRDSRSATRS